MSDRNVQHLDSNDSYMIINISQVSSNYNGCISVYINMSFNLILNLRNILCLTSALLACISVHLVHTVLAEVRGFPRTGVRHFVVIMCSYLLQP